MCERALTGQHEQRDMWGEARMQAAKSISFNPEVGVGMGEGFQTANRDVNY